MEIRKLRVDEQPPFELLLQADPSEDLVKNYLKEGECFIAEIQKHLIGVYVLLPINKERVELKNISVRDQFHGKGLGKRLVLDAINRAKSNGYKTIEVGTGNSSIGQLALYQKCGFRIIGVNQDFFTRHYPEDIIENGIPCKDMIHLSQDLSRWNFEK